MTGKSVDWTSYIIQMRIGSIQLTWLSNYDEAPSSSSSRPQTLTHTGTLRFTHIYKHKHTFSSSNTPRSPKEDTRDFAFVAREFWGFLGDCCETTTTTTWFEGRAWILFRSSSRLKRSHTGLNLDPERDALRCSFDEQVMRGFPENCCLPARRSSPASQSVSQCSVWCCS